MAKKIIDIIKELTVAEKVELIGKEMGFPLYEFGDNEGNSKGRLVWVTDSQYRKSNEAIKATILQMKPFMNSDNVYIV